MKKTYAYVGLVLIALMLLSSFAFAVLQSYFYFPQQQQEVTLPNTNIVDYELSPSQEIRLLQDGKTILKFDYSMNCEACLEQKDLLESFSTNSPFAGQLFLEEVETTKINTTLIVLSIYGQETLLNITQESVTEVLCRLVVQPPTGCVLTQVQ